MILLVALSGALLAQAPPPNPLFEGDAVHEIHLVFDSANWYERLRANFEGKDDPAYAEATFIWGDVRMERAGVRLRVTPVTALTGARQMIPGLEPFPRARAANVAGQLERMLVLERQ